LPARPKKENALSVQAGAAKAINPGTTANALAVKAIDDGPAHRFAQLSDTLTKWPGGAFAVRTTLTLAAALALARRGLLAIDFGRVLNRYWHGRNRTDRRLHVLGRRHGGAHGPGNQHRQADPQPAALHVCTLKYFWIVKPLNLKHCWDYRQAAVFELKPVYYKSLTIW
jgi:hypothetical protein